MATGLHRNPEITVINETGEELQGVGSVEEQIRRRAHEIWLKRGCPVDSEMGDWLAAEEEIRGIMEN